MTITRKLQAGAHVSPGTILHLDYDQFDARRHVLLALGDGHKDRHDTRRLRYSSAEVLFFKAGEELEVEGTIDRPLQTAMGLSDEDLVKADAARPGVKAALTAVQKGQVTKARKRVEAAQAAVTSAEQRLAAAEEAKKPAAQKKLEAAQANLAEAEGALALLGDAT